NFIKVFLQLKMNDIVINSIIKQNRLLLSLLISLFSCSPPTQTEKDLKMVINTTINFGEIDTVFHSGGLLTMQQLSTDYKYKSVVFLQDGCQPCYPKFVEWHEKMDSIDIRDNYTVLFVIAGSQYSGFMSKVLDHGYVDDRFYIVMDTEFQFLAANKDIPRWIIDASVLIDSENKIKMVGAPWINEDMTKLFYEIVSKGKS